MRKEIPLSEKLNLTIEEASAYSGIGVNKIRELTHPRDCPFALRVGSRTLIKRKRFETWLENVGDI